MVCRVQDKTISDVLELLVTEGFEGMADALSILFNEAMWLDRNTHSKVQLQAAVAIIPGKQRLIFSAGQQSINLIYVFVIRGERFPVQLIQIWILLLVNFICQGRNFSACRQSG